LIAFDYAKSELYEGYGLEYERLPLGRNFVDIGEGKAVVQRWEPDDKDLIFSRIEKTILGGKPRY